MSAKKIFFTTDNDQFLPENEALKLGKYTKHIWVNNTLKKEETYIEHRLWGGIYYLSSEENLEELLIELDTTLKWTIRDHKQVVDGYTVWDCRIYDKLQQSSDYSKIVLNADGKKIAAITYDSSTHQIKGGLKIYKFGGQPIPWGDPEDIFDQDSEIIFKLGEDGEVELVYVNEFLFSNDFSYTASQFFRAAGDFFKEMGLSDKEIYYYTHAEPLVPNF